MAARQGLGGALIVRELLRGLQSGKMVKWIVHLVLLLSVPDDVWRTVYIHPFAGSLPFLGYRPHLPGSCAHK